jgi:Pyridoxal phosphate biosynthetic protein PdxA
MRFRFIEDRRADYPVTILCDVLGVSPAGYYAWRSRPESQRSVANRELVDDIKRVHRETSGRYGTCRVEGPGPRGEPWPHRAADAPSRYQGHHGTASPGADRRQVPSLLARLMEVREDEVFLMPVGGGLRIVHVTLRERLHTALDRITPELIERATRTADAALRRLNVRQSRIGVFGINPHGLALSLASPASSFITGAEIPIDGGVSLA